MATEVLQEEQEAPPSKLVIVDDHALVRKGMKSMLDGEPDLRVIGEASDGQEALKVCRSLKPDLILMDVRMPTMDGLAATREIKQELPSTSVLMVTMYENQDYLYEALKAGAAGYVLKESGQEEVLGAVRRVLSGESSLSPGLTAGLLQRLIREKEERKAQAAGAPPVAEEHPEPPSELLTPRETEIIRLVAQGLTNRQMAEKLVVSSATVKTHVQHIIAKLGVSDRTQAAVRAIELGLC